MGFLSVLRCSNRAHDTRPTLPVRGTDRPRCRRDDSIRRRERAHERPPIDVAETADEVGVAVALPGFDHDEVDVRVTDNTLHVSAEPSAADPTEDVTYPRRERPQKPMKRTINLPLEVDEEEQPGHYVPPLVGRTKR